ncbi:MAG TPA: acyl-CoA dehydrogenase family protein [Steroidobacteraceae bacterium]|jgi:alkylation response protein AidB-like acyl-CoA dehydrogenase|nr:acyl-CoA dehydrogenase family protein [Steroidobacteraceae bacterium]
MDFSYTEEQLALQETLQRFVSREYDFETRRNLSSSDLGFSADAWKQYADLGLLSLPIPEEYGGLGGNAVDIMLIMEMVGRGLLLEPYFSSVVLSGCLIRDAAPAAMKQAVLPAIAAGKLKVAFACYEAAGRYDLAHVATRAVSDGKGGWRLTGDKSVVQDGPSADRYLVSARISGSLTDRDGLALFLVDRNAPGVSLTGYTTQCGRRAADVRFENVVVGADAMIGGPGKAIHIIERGVDRGIAALCAEAIGIMTALNEATLNHLKTRKQFGVPIGKFQALQHRMADMFIATEQARSMAIIAAVHADSDDAAARQRAISGAKTYIGQAARLVSQQAVQLHGGMGLVDEMIVSHYFKRLTMINIGFGDADYHMARFSSALEA